MNPRRHAILAPLFAVLALLCGLAGSASAAFNHAAQNPHYGNFLLQQSEASDFESLQLADPTKGNGEWIYDSALGVPVYVRQNPWTAFDPLGLYGAWGGYGMPGGPTMRTATAEESRNARAGFVAGVMNIPATMGQAILFIPELVSGGGMPFTQGLQGLKDGTSGKIAGAMGADASDGNFNAARNFSELFGTLGVGKGLSAAGNKLSATTARGISEKANYAQKTFSQEFSDKGKKIYTKLVGSEINTVDDLAAAIRSGKVSPDEIPIEYVMKGNQQLIVNTRTSQALERAGVKRSNWNAVDKTDDLDTMARVDKNLRKPRNNLDDRGTPTVTEEVTPKVKVYE